MLCNKLFYIYTNILLLQLILLVIVFSVCATGSWVCATHACADEDKIYTPKAVPVKSKPNDEEQFGYMDNKYDTKDADDDYDDSEDDEKFNDIIKNENAKKEYNWLTPAEKKKLNHLETNIKKFYIKVNGSRLLGEDLKNDKEDDDDLDDDSEDDDSDSVEDETPSEEKEDELLDQYEDLLDKSEVVRNKLHSLRDAIRTLEQRRAAHKRNHQLDVINKKSDVHINSIHDGKTRPANNKQGQQQSARKTALVAKLDRDRQRSETDNDIWEDQWKAKVRKHQHNLFSNHL